MGTRRFLQSLIADATRRLGAIEAGNPPLEAEHLMTTALGTDRKGFLGLGEDDSLDPAVLGRFEALLTRRLAREPLQYVLGTVPFCELELEVGPGVLIPRSETEILVEKVTAWLRRSPECSTSEGPSIGGDRDSPKPAIERSRDANTGPAASPGRAPRLAEATARRHQRLPWMIDVGTGSGAILLALLRRFPGWNGLGIDLSGEALAYARRNRETALRRAPGKRQTAVGREGTELKNAPAPARLSAPAPVANPVPDRSPAERAHLVMGNGLESVATAALPSGGRDAGPVRLIVSNPPYIPSIDIASLAPEIRDHEPRLALDGGADGLEIVRPLIATAAVLLGRGGLFAMELSYDQPEEVARGLRRDGRFGRVEMFKDLAGRSRGVLAERC